MQRRIGKFFYSLLRNTEIDFLCWSRHNQERCVLGFSEYKKINIIKERGKFVCNKYRQVSVQQKVIPQQQGTCCSDHRSVQPTVWSSSGSPLGWCSGNHHQPDNVTATRTSYQQLQFRETVLCMKLWRNSVLWLVVYKLCLIKNVGLRRGFQKLQSRRFFTSSLRGIGESFQLAITTPRLGLIGCGTATAQS